MRAIAIVLFLVWCASSARAQAIDPQRSTAERLRVARLARERESIREENRAGVFLSAAGAALFGAGLSVGIGIEAASICLWGSCGDRTPYDIAAAVAFAVGGVGLVLLLVGIILRDDVDKRRLALSSMMLAATF